MTPIGAGFHSSSAPTLAMDLNRRLGCGRLAEIFGERAVGVDSYSYTGYPGVPRTKAKILGSRKQTLTVSMAYIEVSTPISLAVVDH